MATTTSDVDPNGPLARGHQRRTGHALTGYYVPTDQPGVGRLVRTCACATLRTVDSDLQHRNGERVEVVSTITEPDAAHDAEALPMVVVRFLDGSTAEVWPDEVVSA